MIHYSGPRLLHATGSADDESVTRDCMVLPSDPLTDFTEVKDVKMTFKRGVEIKVP